MSKEAKNPTLIGIPRRKFLIAAGVGTAFGSGWEFLSIRSQQSEVSDSAIGKYGEFQPYFVRDSLNPMAGNAISLFAKATKAEGFHSSAHRGTSEVSKKAEMQFTLANTDGGINYSVKFGIPYDKYTTIKGQGLKGYVLLDKLNESISYLTYTKAVPDTNLLQSASMALQKDGVNWSYTNSHNRYQATTNEQEIRNSQDGHGKKVIPFTNLRFIEYQTFGEQIQYVLEELAIYHPPVV